MDSSEKAAAGHLIPSKSLPLVPNPVNQSLAPRGIVEFFRGVLRAYFQFFHHSTFQGQEHIPPEGPCLFASNHVSYYDPLLVAAGQTLPMRFMAWDALFNRGMFDRLIRYFGAFPVDTEGNDPGGYRVCLELLKRGQRILIFPEGGRSETASLVPFREGVARLAMKAQVPIVPVCILGGNAAWPRGDTAPRPWFPIHVRYLPLVQPRQTRTPQERHDEAKRLMNEVRSSIQRCLESGVS